MAGRKWEQWEDEFLINNYKHATVSQMGEKLQRSKSSVQSRKRILGITVNQNNENWSIEKIKQRLIEDNRDIILLSDEYINYNSNLTWYCNKHNYKWEACIGTVIARGSGCRLCGFDSMKLKQSLNIDEVKSRLLKINKNLEILDDIYINEDSPMTVKCKADGYEWKTTWASLRQRHSTNGCPICCGNKKLSIEEIKDRLQSINANIEILSDSYQNNQYKLKLRCKIDNTIWYQKWNHLNSGHGCPKCADKKSSERQRGSIDKVIKDIEVINPKIKIISDFYENSKTKLTCECLDCGNIWKANSNNLKNGTGCPLCASSRGEKIIYNYLQNHNANFKTQFEFKDCVDIKPLRFDFVVFHDNDIFAIEYDGIQHFEAVDYFGGVNALNTNQRRDGIKNNYCTANEIMLVRIPYWEFKNIVNILDTELHFLLEKEG